MSDARDYVATIRGIADEFYSKGDGRDYDVYALHRAADMIERLTKPITFDECVEILVRRKHKGYENYVIKRGVVSDFFEGFQEWAYVADSEGKLLMNEFEVKALARAYMVEKEAANV